MLEESLPANVPNEPGEIALRLLGEMLGTSDGALDAARTRYRQASEGCAEPPIVPMHPVVMGHVVRPLMEAKRCYVLGMPVACIAQAGLVGEMVALWRFRMLSSMVDGKPFDDKMQELLMGRVFDKLGQQERVRVLQALDSLDSDLVKAFDELRLIRRRYLHFMIDQTQDVDADARQALRLASVLVAKTLGVQFNEGRIVLPDKVARFISDMFQRDGTQPECKENPSEGT
jgi:hypothetical protein